MRVPSLLFLRPCSLAFALVLAPLGCVAPQAADDVPPPAYLSARSIYARPTPGPAVDPGAASAGDIAADAARTVDADQTYDPDDYVTAPPQLDSNDGGPTSRPADEAQPYGGDSGGTYIPSRDSYPPLPYVGEDPYAPGSFSDSFYDGYYDSGDPYAGSRYDDYRYDRYPYRSSYDGAYDFGFYSGSSYGLFGPRYGRNSYYGRPYLYPYGNRSFRRDDDRNDDRGRDGDGDRRPREPAPSAPEVRTDDDRPTRDARQAFEARQRRAETETRSDARRRSEARERTEVRERTPRQDSPRRSADRPSRDARQSNDREATRRESTRRDSSRRENARSESRNESRSESRGDAQRGGVGRAPARNDGPRGGGSSRGNGDSRGGDAPRRR